MIYFLLPKNNPNLYNKIVCKIHKHEPIPCISQSLAYYLYDIKERIKGKEDEWDECKKYTNPYEYIHTAVPYKKKGVAKYKPLSRAYFKMVEILNVFNLHSINGALSSFHLAEGPGGFIEAIANIRGNRDDRYIGMTLLDDNNDDNIPAWKKTDVFLRDHPNVFIETGADKTGNILSIENLDYCKDKYKSSMDIITADGGFDFSSDFNNQESNMSKLLFAQICFALCMQKRDGSFVLKIFDCFTEATVDLLYILSAFYKKVYITKPQTSRYANSEKYLVCKGFLYESCDGIYASIRSAFETMIHLQSQPDDILRFISTPVSHFFLTRLEEFNAVFGQQQIETIHMTLSIIDNKHKGDKIDAIIKSNIQKCLYWCIKNNIHYCSTFSITPNEEYAVHVDK